MRRPAWQHEGSMDQARRRAIIDALEHCDQSVTKAARRLRIGRSTLYRFIKAFDISVAPRSVQDICTSQPIKKAPPTKVEVREREGGQQSRLVQIDGQLFIVR
jgi:transposase